LGEKTNFLEGQMIAFKEGGPKEKNRKEWGGEIPRVVS